MPLTALGDTMFPPTPVYNVHGCISHPAISLAKQSGPKRFGFQGFRERPDLD
jgi:hypothetical protein